MMRRTAGLPYGLKLLTRPEPPPPPPLPATLAWPAPDGSENEDDCPWLNKPVVSLLPCCCSNELWPLAIDQSKATGSDISNQGSLLDTQCTRVKRVLSLSTAARREGEYGGEEGGNKYYK